MSYGPLNSINNTYLPTFRNFDQDDDQLRVLLNKTYTETAFAVNFKENGIYELVELQNGQQFPFVAPTTPGGQQFKRFGFRKIFFLSANASTFTFPHGITGFAAGSLQFTHIWGVLDTSTDQRPLPYVDVTNVTNQVGINVNPTVGGNVTINMGATATAITGGIVVLEYLKN